MNRPEEEPSTGNTPPNGRGTDRGGLQVPTRTRLLVGLALLFAFVSLGLHQIVINDDPEAFDTSGYLLEANRIARHGGLAAFPRMVIEGKYEQSNQHPLYILAITPFAEIDFDFMVSAKLISLFFGVLAVLSGYLLIQRLYSHLVATLATAGFLLTHLFIRWSTLVACESLLVFLSIVGVAAVIAGFRDSKYWRYAGLFIGLAYLTKITALLLLPGFVVAAVLTTKGRVLATRDFYLFFAAFLVGCSPLLINNAIVFGNPIYNSNIDNLSDSRADVAYNEISFERGSMVRIYKSVVAEKSEKGEISIDGNDVFDLAGDVLRRLPREFTLFLETLSVWPMHVAPKPLRWTFGAALLGLFLVGVRREQQIGAQVYLVVTLITFLTALSLHRPLPRYLLPTTYFVWVFAAMGLLYLLEKSRRFVNLDYRRLESVARTAAVTLLLGIGGYILSTKPVSAVGDSVSVSEHRQELVQWMRDNIAPGERYLEGPNFGWVVENGVHLFPTSEVRSSRERFEQFAWEHDVRYVILERESMNLYRYRGKGIDRRLKFEGIVEFDEHGEIIEGNLPDGWTKAAMSKNGIINFIVYELGGTTRDDDGQPAAVEP